VNAVASEPADPFLPSREFRGLGNFTYMGGQTLEFLSIEMNNLSSAIFTYPSLNVPEDYFLFMNIAAGEWSLTVEVVQNQSDIISFAPNGTMTEVDFDPDATIRAIPNAESEPGVTRSLEGLGFFFPMFFWIIIPCRFWPNVNHLVREPLDYIHSRTKQLL